MKHRHSLALILAVAAQLLAPLSVSVLHAAATLRAVGSITYRYF